MKRTFDQITQDPSQPSLELLYGLTKKRKKLTDQRVGDFISNAKDVIHFKIANSATDLEQQTGFFEAKFLDWVSNFKPANAESRFLAKKS